MVIAAGRLQHGGAALVKIRRCKSVMEQKQFAYHQLPIAVSERHVAADKQLIRGEPTACLFKVR